MTCIVGIEHEGTVYIGGDSAGVSGLDVVVRSDEKVFINGPLIMGFTSSFRMGQLLRYAVDVPEQDPRHDDMKYLVVDVMDHIRDCFHEKGFLAKEDNVETGGVFLMGYKGRLYWVGSDFQVGRHLDGYAACGCGENYAMGVLHYLSRAKPKMSPEDKIKAALEAAAYHSGGVLEPYTILHLP